MSCNFAVILGITTDNHSPVNQKIVLKFLSQLGYQSIKAVWNGVEALQYISSSLENGRFSSPRQDGAGSPASPGKAGESSPRLVNIILMDVQMPVMDGYVASRKLRTEFPFVGDARLLHVPIIALTASAIQGDRKKCLEAGMSDYLAKPVRKETLATTLAKWLANPPTG